MSFYIRKAKVKDARKIQQIVNHFADKELMLALSLNEIFDSLRDFTIIEKEGEIIGAGALHIMWEDLAEIRSLAVKETYQRKGYAGQLVERLISEAKEFKFEKIFVFTYQKKFFKKFGFEQIDKNRLPHKVWTDCLNCPKFENCDEIAMMKWL